MILTTEKTKEILTQEGLKPMAIYNREVNSELVANHLNTIRYIDDTIQQGNFLYRIDYKNYKGGM